MRVTVAGGSDCLMPVSAYNDTLEVNDRCAQKRMIRNLHLIPLLSSLCFLSPAQTVVTLPSYSVKGLTYVACSIGDSGPLQCLLDTGSSMTGISSSLAKRLNLRPHDDNESLRPDLQGLEDVIIHAGNASWKAARVSVTPSDIAILDAESGEGLHTDVVLGTSILERFQVTFDPASNEIHLSDPGTPPPALFEKIPAVFIHEVPFTMLQVETEDGRAVPGPFSLDTGSRPALLLSRNFWAARPALALASGSADSEKFNLRKIRFGGHELSNIVSYRPTGGGGLLSSQKVGGVIGTPILNRYCVIYDLKLGEIWIHQSPP